MSAATPSATEVGEMRALVVGREIPAVAHRLAAIRERIAGGDDLDPDDRALLLRIRYQYGRELTELLDPEE